MFILFKFKKRGGGGGGGGVVRRKKKKKTTYTNLINFIIFNASQCSKKEVCFYVFLKMHKKQ